MFYIYSFLVSIGLAHISADVLAGYLDSNSKSTTVLSTTKLSGISTNEFRTDVNNEFEFQKAVARVLSISPDDVQVKNVQSPTKQEDPDLLHLINNDNKYTVVTYEVLIPVPEGSLASNIATSTSKKLEAASSDDCSGNCLHQFEEFEVSSDELQRLSSVKSKLHDKLLEATPTVAPTKNESTFPGWAIALICVCTILIIMGAVTAFFKCKDIYEEGKKVHHEVRKSDKDVIASSAPAAEENTNTIIEDDVISPVQPEP